MASERTVEARSLKGNRDVDNASVPRKPVRTILYMIIMSNTYRRKPLSEYVI